MNDSSTSTKDLTQIGIFWYDYMIFLLMLIVSTGIGVYYGYFGTKQKTISEYLLGSKQMTVFPVGISIAVGHFSGVTLLARPADVYKYGAFLWLSCISMVLLVLLSVFLYLPVFFNLQLTCAYEYVEKRFDSKTRLLMSCLYILNSFACISIIAYTPALALSTATGINAELISCVICGVCVFYTTVGGLKAVVWTDFFQFFIIIATLVLVSVIGIKAAGGMSSIWNAAIQGGRLDIFDFDLDPTKRESVWIYLIGFTVDWTWYIVLSQSGIQKFLTLPTYVDWVWAIIVFAIVMSIVNSFAVLLGLLVYEKYSKCDPLTSHKIEKHEQLIPYYIMDIAGHIPGVSGCLLMSIFCAALSTVSVLLNALSGVIYEDFVIKFFKPNFTEKTGRNILKSIVAISGIICTCLVLVVKHLGEIVPLIISVYAAIGGPSMGVFTLGMLVPKANAKGAFYGAIAGFISLLIMMLPSRLFDYDKLYPYPSKFLSIKGCGSWNQSKWIGRESSNNTLSLNIDPVELPPSIFRISFYYHSVVGALVTVVVGWIISFMTNKNDPPVDRILISPVCHFLLPKAPKSEIELQGLTGRHNKEEN